VPQRGNRQRIVNDRLVPKRNAEFAEIAEFFHRNSRRPRRARRSVFWPLVVALVVSVRSGSAQTPSQLPTAIPQTKFASGQNVVPYFEGWIKNADGSFDLVFGYFNRNWEQSLVIPVGQDNRVEIDNPEGKGTATANLGNVDRGQPTFFLPRRQGWVYRVRVPANFGKQVMRWTIKSNDKTETAYGELLPVEEITERIIMTRGNLNPGDDDPNKPPTVSIAPVDAATTSEATLVATVTDDGLPKPRVAIQRTQAADATRIQQQTNSVATAQRRGLNVTWMQLRGPARIAFGASGATLVADGKASTSARFPLPGTYVVRAIANDGALATRSDLTITVR
jgi:hypothetical protein